MPLADQRAGRPELALWVTANEELGQGDRNGFPFHLPGRHYD
jgi:hypothetical protein